MQLHEYITSHLNKPFEWGVNDCCTFTVGWIEAETGVDYLSKYKPWTNEKQAKRILKKLGGIWAMFDKHLTPIHPNMATDGCVSVVDGVASIVSGNHVVSVGVNGLTFKDRGEAICAWKLIKNLK